jgi:hypothetical protein
MNYTRLSRAMDTIRIGEYARALRTKTASDSIDRRHLSRVINNASESYLLCVAQLSEAEFEIFDIWRGCRAERRAELEMLMRDAISLRISLPDQESSQCPSTAI